MLCRITVFFIQTSLTTGSEYVIALPLLYKNSNIHVAILIDSSLICLCGGYIRLDSKSSSLTDFDKFYWRIYIL